ncbi:MAG: hypothetical protein ACKVS5_15905 [Parvularculaceae bacterium]
MSIKKQPRAPTGEAASGYLASALVFAGVTALWAFIVRDDPYYRLTDVFGTRVPAMLIAYLALMPLAGFIVGRWRYDRGRGGFASFAAKLGARALHFSYAHSLVVLFTGAMLAETWLGLNLDQQVKRIDDRMFDFAARFVPWLAAYLTGFNFGRATIAGAMARAAARPAARDAAVFIEAPPAEETVHPLRGPAMGSPGRAGAEPPMSATPRPLLDPLGAAPPKPATHVTASGLALSAQSADAASEHGFLPPQDIDRLRPAFGRLR